MIDLALMALGLRRLTNTCALGVIGRSHQLASVEAGALMREMCTMAHLPYDAKSAQTLMHTTGFLYHNFYRCYPIFAIMSAYCKKADAFASDSGIGQFAELVKNGTHTDCKLLNTPFCRSARAYTQP